MARENVIADGRSIDNAGELLDGARERIDDAGEFTADAGDLTTGTGEFTDDTGRSGRLDIDCPSCDRRFTFGEWARPVHGERVEPSCPTCDESFSVRVGTEFALVERDGWAVSVSVGREGPRR